MFQPLRYCIVGLLLSLSLNGPAWAGLVVTDAWIAAAPPGVRTMAGYFTATNDGTEDVRILGASSRDFRRIELHTVVTDGEMHGMRPVEEIAVPPGDAVFLAPGERHLMLIDGGCDLQAGDSVFVKLRTAEGDEIPVTFKVRHRDPTGTHHH
jgi:copper(I)-binding protein